MEGRIVPVTCFTNCDTVELFLNGKSFGVKGYNFPREGMENSYGNLPPRSRVLRTTSDLHLSWDVPYEPGTLKAVGVSNGRIVATEEIATTGDPAAIEMTADNSSPAADRRDVVHLTVRILDADGRMVPTAVDDVTFAVQGQARLIGVDNGEPSSHDSYQADHRPAFGGLCLAILQTTSQAGPIQVTASAKGRRGASITINSAEAAATPVLP
jgi:beta-galactosidase